MRVLALLPIVALAACTTQDVGTPSGKAHFAAYPDSLFDAFESACGGPAQSFRRPEPDMVECREYLPPEATAALILSFDGTTEALPELVIRFRAEAADAAEAFGPLGPPNQRFDAFDEIVTRVDINAGVAVTEGGIAWRGHRKTQELNQTLMVSYVRSGKGVESSRLSVFSGYRARIEFYAPHVVASSASQSTDASSDRCGTGPDPVLV